MAFSTLITTSTTLGQLVESYWSGYSFKSNEYTEDGVPVLTKGDIKPRGLIEHGGKFVPWDLISSKSIRLTEADDFLVSTRDLTTAANFLGLVSRAPNTPHAVNQGVTVFKVKTNIVDKSYLAYWCESPVFRGHIKGHYAGATQIHIRHADLMAAPVMLPNMSEQRRIASILSAYDDLIENNTRRIAILEEMARRIYEEWFVHFRFPGHEQVKMVESELGLIPGGWKIQPLVELLEHHIGGGWGQENHSDDFPVAAYVIRGTDIPDARSSNLGRSPLRFHKESNFRTRKLQPGDIVFEVSGGSKDQPVGRAVLLRSKLFASADHPIICASFCRLVRANKTAILPELLQLHFERIYESREIMKYQTQSTGITNFKFTVFTEKELVLVPPQDIQKQFQSFVDSLYGLASTLGVKNTNLRTTRDLLLPKLISGELDVSNLPEFARLTDPEEAIAA